MLQVGLELFFSPGVQLGILVGVFIFCWGTWELSMISDEIEGIQTGWMFFSWPEMDVQKGFATNSHDWNASSHCYFFKEVEQNNV